MYKPKQKPVRTDEKIKDEGDDVVDNSKLDSELNDVIKDSNSFSRLLSNSFEVGTEFSTFNEVFVTEEEIEKAKEKLNQEQVSSLMNQFHDSVDLVLSICSKTPSSESEVNSNSHKAQLIFNFLVLGMGHICLVSDTVIWKGFLKDNIATLEFELIQMSDLKVKNTSDTPEIFLFTYKDQFFFQFGFLSVAGGILDRIMQSHKMVLTSRTNRLSMDEMLDEAKKKLSRSIEEATETYEKEVLRIKALFSQSNNIESSVGICNICYSEKEDLELLPCLHRICEYCFSRLEYRVCPWDRLEIFETNLLV